MTASSSDGRRRARSDWRRPGRPGRATCCGLTRLLSARGGAPSYWRIRGAGVAGATQLLWCERANPLECRPHSRCRSGAKALPMPTSSSARRREVEATQDSERAPASAPRISAAADDRPLLRTAVQSGREGVRIAGVCASPHRTPLLQHPTASDRRQSTGRSCVPAGAWVSERLGALDRVPGSDRYGVSVRNPHRTSLGRLNTFGPARARGAVRGAGPLSAQNEGAGPRNCSFAERVDPVGRTLAGRVLHIDVRAGRDQWLFVVW